MTVNVVNLKEEEKVAPEPVQESLTQKIESIEPELKRRGRPKGSTNKPKEEHKTGSPALQARTLQPIVTTIFTVTESVTSIPFTATNPKLQEEVAKSLALCSEHFIPTQTNSKWIAVGVLAFNLSAVTLEALAIRAERIKSKSSGKPAKELSKTEIEEESIDLENRGSLGMISTKVGL